MTDSRRPDPAQGVFETLLVVDGRPIELDAHLARLAASLEGLFGSGPPDGAPELVLDRARDTRLGRLRLTVAPDGAGGLGVEVVTAEADPALVFPPWERGVGLRSFVVEDGLGAHKWADRGLLREAEASAPTEAVPLLVDGNDTVLEASRANVFVVRDGALTTPPTDGRILPGIARRRAIEVAGEEGIELRKAEVPLDDLLQADEVFLTGSVRGVEPVRSVDGSDLPPAEEVTSRIAAGLRRRWLD